jgi:hypothetical protein
VNHSALAAYRTLTADAVLDAARRRIVAAIAVVTLLSLWLVRGCTACGSGSYTIDGQVIDPSRVAGFTGVAIYALLALWTMTLAGVLASDHLKQTLDDGSAPLTLARPVGRGTFALARLSGSLVVSLSTGAVLLAATAALLYVRQGLPIAPAVAGACVCALAAVSIAALAMALSLALPRVATFLVVFALVSGVTALNLAALTGVELSGIAYAVDRFGPPLGTALMQALGPWVGRPPASLGQGDTTLRLVLWATASVALLVAAFRRVEIRT